MTLPMEKKASQSEEQETSLSVFKPQHPELEMLETSTLHQLLSDSTVESLETFIENTVDIGTVGQLAKEFKSGIYTLFGTIGAYFLLSPLVVKKGSPEEIACAISVLGLSAYFSAKLYRINVKMNTAAAEEQLSQYKAVTAFLPHFYEVLSTHTYERLNRIAKILCAYRVHAQGKPPSLSSTQYVSLQEMQEIYASIRLDISMFPERLRAHMQSAETRMKATTAADAIPSITNRLIRTLWREWSDIENQIQRIEQILNTKKKPQ